MTRIMEGIILWREIFYIQKGCILIRGIRI